MKITVTVEVPNTNSFTIADALGGVSREIARAGYVDGEVGRAVVVWNEDLQPRSTYIKFRVDLRTS